MHLRQRQASSSARIDWTGHATLDDLSPELLDRVVHECSSGSKRKHGLLLLRLVSSRFAAAGLRYMWRRLVLELSAVKRNDAIVASLEAQPSQGAHIRRLSVRRTPFSTMAGPTDLERAIAVLSRATSLTDLELRTRLRHDQDGILPAAMAGTLAGALMTFAETIKRFSCSPPLAEAIEDVQRGAVAKWPLPGPLASAFVAWTHLTRLDAWQVSFEHTPIAGYAPTFRLAHLSLNQVVIPPAALTWLLKSSSEGKLLREIEFIAVLPSELATDEMGEFRNALCAVLREAAPTLVRISLHMTRPGVFEGDSAQIAIRRMAGLRRLALTAEDLDYDTAEVILSTCRHLQYLAIAASNALEPPMLVQLIRRSPPPYLRRLCIEPSSHAFVPVPAGVRNPEPRIWAWTRQERRALRAFCDLHSVSLTLEGTTEPLEVELSSADEADPTSALNPGGEADEPEDEDDPDELFELDDTRRAWWEEERRHDEALLEKAKHDAEDDQPSSDDFLGPSSEEDM